LVLYKFEIKENVMRFQERRFAEEYDTRLSGEGYPGELFDYIAEELSGLKSVIDVGAGTGFFSIPLARRGYRVTAVEPSAAMIDILLRKAGKKTFSSLITVDGKRWEDFDGARADSIISVHSLYGIRDKASALLKMTEYGDKRIVIVTNINRTTDTLTGRIRDSISGGTASSRLSIDMRQILESFNIPYSVRDIEQIRTAYFTDINMEAEYYCYHLRLDKKNISKVRDILNEITLHDETGYTFQLHYFDQMFVF